MKNIDEPGKINHLYTFCVVSALNCYSSCLFQSFIFDIVSKTVKLSFRSNCSLQIFSLFFFFGSFIWAKLADKTHKHNLIIVLSKTLYGLLVFSILMIQKINGERLRQISIIFVTILRESTLGTCCILDSLLINYLIRTERGVAHVSYLSFSKNIGMILAMLTSTLISSYCLESHRIYVKCIFYVVFTAISSVILLFVIPKYRKIESEISPKTRSTENLNQSNSLIDLFKTKSFAFLYLCIIIAGIYKCIATNFLMTFLRVRKLPEKTPNICFTIRSITESVTLIPLSKINRHRSSLLIVGLASATLAMAISIIFRFSTISLFISEIFNGLSRSVTTFASVLLFKSYSNPETLTQVQGIRNGGYNGISCVLFGIIAFCLIPSNIYDPKVVPDDQKLEMEQSLGNIFINSYKISLGLLIFSLIPGLAVYLLRKKNQ